MKVNNKVQIIILLQNLVIIAALDCVDIKGKFLIPGGPRPRSCAWATRKNPHKRCSRAMVKASCPNSCHSDCLRYPDSPDGCRDSTNTFNVHFFKRKIENCSWVAKVPGERCRKWPNARKWCPVTCGTCGNEPSAAPSLTNAPTLPHVPTMIPSDMPSVQPTYICEDVPDSERFYVPEIMRSKSCYWASYVDVRNRCSYAIVGEKCPRTCGNCIDSPSNMPSVSLQPSSIPSDEPSQQPSYIPSDGPSKKPSDEPSQQPSLIPSDEPSQEPSTYPSLQPSDQPSDQPSQQPSSFPSDEPSLQPSDGPSLQPSKQPSDQPSEQPSECRDDINWSVAISGGDLTCAAATTTTWCTEHADVRGMDKIISEACCICGGSIDITIAPSDQPSDQPSEQPSECNNKPSWQAGSFACADFSSLTSCNLVSAADSDGHTNAQACVSEFCFSAFYYNVIFISKK